VHRNNILVYNSN